MTTSGTNDADGHQTCVVVTDAKWWIDYRDLTDADFIAKGGLHVSAADTNIADAQLTSMATVA